MEVFTKVIGRRDPVTWACIAAATISPYGTPILGWVNDNEGVRIGWQEEKLTRPPFAYFEREREVFRAHCEHNAYLLSAGYVDIDTGTINWTHTDSGRLITFDKDAVRRAQDFDMDLYMTILLQSYKTLPATVEDEIRATQGNPAKLLQAFEWLRGVC